MNETEVGHHRRWAAKEFGIEIPEETVPPHLKEMQEDLARLLCKVQIAWHLPVGASTFWRSMPVPVKEEFRKKAAFILKKMG